MGFTIISCFMANLYFFFSYFILFGKLKFVEMFQPWEGNLNLEHLMYILVMGCSWDFRCYVECQSGPCFCFVLCMFLCFVPFADDIFPYHFAWWIVFFCLLIAALSFLLYSLKYSFRSFPFIDFGGAFGGAF